MIINTTHHKINHHALLSALTNVGMTAMGTIKNNGIRLVFRNENGAAAIAVKSGNSRKELASLPIEGGTFEIDGVQYNLVKTTETGDIGAPAAWKLYTMTEVPCSIQGKIPAAATLPLSGFENDFAAPANFLGANGDANPSTEAQEMAMFAQLLGGGGDEGQINMAGEESDEPVAAGFNKGVEMSDMNPAHRSKKVKAAAGIDEYGS